MCNLAQYCLKDSHYYLSLLFQQKEQDKQRQTEIGQSSMFWGNNQMFCMAEI